ncbi:MAG: histidine--tRNA ligase, partial [Phycisphaerales bacterium]
MTDPKPAKRTLRAPPGTRDFYPADLLRRRYIEKAWRDTAIRHGFEEIDGPTFETAELYKVKSGEGILNEMFGVFSGKAEDDLKQLRETGEAPYALRPEFTPTLARMYAARAAQLPKPCKWFWQQNCFRAERQQRGRLREFAQWNCDIVGTENEPEAQARADADIINCVIDSIAMLGISSEQALCKLSDRRIFAASMSDLGVPPDLLEAVANLVDRRSKLTNEQFAWEAGAVGISKELAISIEQTLSFVSSHHWHQIEREMFPDDSGERPVAFFNLLHSIEQAGRGAWCKFDAGVVRGLAYYTGMVFEVLAEGERAIAGGGRYDNLIELFGGPPTPAVGFGMGDVVLSLLLTDKGLMPEGKDLLDALSRPAASFRPDVFVISNGKEESDAAVRPLVARLRRGTESEGWLTREGRKPWDADRYVGEAHRSESGATQSPAPTIAAPPLHARHSYK